MKPRRNPIDRVPITEGQLDFCQRRTEFLLRDIPFRTLSFLLANAYHQGLGDAVEMYEKMRVMPMLSKPITEPWIEP